MIVDWKHFTFFVAKHWNLLWFRRQNLNFFVADCMPEWRVTGVEKSKNLSVADCIPEFSVSALKKVKFFQSTITYAVFLLFFIPNKPKIRLFNAENPIFSRTNYHPKIDPRFWKSVFSHPHGTPKTGFRARFPLKNFRQRFSGTSFSGGPRYKNELF